MKNKIMVLYTIALSTILMTAVVGTAFAQPVPPLEVNEQKSVNESLPIPPPVNEQQSIGKITIKLSEKESLEIDLPYKNGDTYKIISK